MPGNAHKPDNPERMLVPRKSKVDLAQAWKLRVVNGLSFKEIAQTLGCSKSTVHAALERLHRILPDPALVNAYDGVEAQLMTAGKARLLASLLDENCIKAASLNNRAYAFQQLFQAHRTSTGKANVNVSILTKYIEQADENLFTKETTSRDMPVAPEMPPKLKGAVRQDS